MKILTQIFLILLTLKLFNLITINWIWILLPVIIPLAFTALNQLIVEIKLLYRRWKR